MKWPRRSGTSTSRAETDVMAFVKAPCFDYEAKTKGKERDYGLTPAEIKPLWDYMRKRYLDQGFTIQEAIDNMVRETSRRHSVNNPGGAQIPARFFQEVVTGRKGERIKTGQEYLAEDERRQAQWQIQQAIDRADNSVFTKMAKTASALPRASLTLLHAGVFPVTHGGELLMHPKQWKAFAQGWWTTMQTLPLRKGATAAYDRMRLQIYNDADYGDFRAGGVRVGVDERAQGLIDAWISKKPGWSQYAWLGLIKMRMELMKQLLRKEKWSTREEKMDLIKNLAPLVNHATGVVESSAPFGLFSPKFFSPQLTYSKYARGFGDPFRMFGIVGRMALRSETSSAERAFAR